MSDLVLTAQESKVEPQEKVSALLMKDKPHIGTRPFIYQPTFPDSEPAEASEEIKETPFRPKTLCLFQRGRITLVRKAVIIEGAKQVKGLRGLTGYCLPNLFRELLEVNPHAELILGQGVHVSAVHEYG